MRDYTVRTADQLTSLLRSFRNRRGKGQSQIAIELGTTQQEVSRLERDPAATSVERLMKVLAALEVDLVLRDRKGKPELPLESDGPTSERW
jgi:HTH-type transcriptional regulator/antitoxin HipB